jgi:myo-inositol-1(or 4)-monophosphatase
MDFYRDIASQVVKITREVSSYIEQECLKFSMDKVETKNTNDFVSYVDKDAERLLVDKLSLLIPNSGFITEEGTTKQRNNEEFCWIIDPLDGTSNFIHGSTPYAISVALSYKQELVVGVIHEITRNETFYAWQGSKAYLNGNEIKVSNTDKVSNSLIATGRPHSYMEQYALLLNLMDYFLQNTHGVRQSGSAASDLAYVACGRYDGRYEFGLKPWDIAAGILIVKQAGGQVCDFMGDDNYFDNGSLIASNSEIFIDFSETIKKINQKFGYLDLNLD